MIPKVISFNFGFSSDFAGKPFNLIHFLAVKSAKIVNNCEILLYYKHAPNENPWWEEAKKYCTMIECNPPTEIFENKLEFAAYQSDVFRLEWLNTNGGIYFDIDTISIKPIDSLLSYNFVMGEEWANGKQFGLCNAVMMAEKGSEFGKLWLEEYKNYDPNWGVMSVVRPMEIAKKYPNLIKVEPFFSFFKYSWSEEDLKIMHTEPRIISGAYVLHLWEQTSYDRYLNGLTPEIIQKNDTAYNILARRFL